MNFYYDRYVCTKCHRKFNLVEGATYCPHCAGKLKRVQSGKAKTKNTLHFLHSFVLGAAIPLMILNRVTIDSAAIYVIGAIMLLGGLLGCKEFVNFNFKKRRESHGSRKAV